MLPVQLRSRQLESLELRICLSAVPTLIADIHPVVDPESVVSNSSNIGGLFEFNGEVYFRADSGPRGVELWKTDGTADGTVLVRDIFAQTALIDGRITTDSNPRDFTEVSDQLFFYADRNRAGEDGSELFTALYKTDGTRDGTVMIKDVGTKAFPRILGSLDGELYFDVVEVDSEGVSFDIWKTDGTEAGTQLVFDFPRGGFIGFFTHKMGNELFFDAATEEHGVELWKTNGTAEGTQLVSDVNPGPNAASFPGSPVEIDGTLFFVSELDDPNSDDFLTHLYKTDGTREGTERVSEIHVDRDVSLFVHDGLIYFVGGTDETGFEPYRSDGTTEGTFILGDLDPGEIGSIPQGFFTALDQVLFFAVDADAVNEEGGFPQLWTTDGTLNSATKVSDAFVHGSQNVVEFEGHLYFGGFTGGIDAVNLDILDDELIRSDGTPEGTVVMQGPVEGWNTIWPKTVYDGKLYMTAHTEATGHEIWSTDGTTEGFELSEVAPGEFSAPPNFIGFQFFPYEDILLFVAAESREAGDELWKLEAASTELPGDFNSDSVLDATDIDLLFEQMRSPTPDLTFDLDGDNLVNDADRDLLVIELMGVGYGDADLNGRFDSGDLVDVFVAGQYEDETVGNSTWATGDWNGDGEFDSSDLVLALQRGQYEF